MARRTGFVCKALLVPACVAYQILVHSAMLHGQPGNLRLALSLLPLLGFAVWIARCAQHKAAWSLALAAGAVSIYVVEHEAQLGLAAAYGVPHAAIYLILLATFGRTLAPGREPIITGFARRVHGSLPPHMQAYTRRLTRAWCLFFAAQIAISAALFMLAPLHVWSLFVNVLNLPLLVSMFGAEYLYRTARHRDFPHASIMKGVQMFTERASLSDSGPVPLAPRAET